MRPLEVSLETRRLDVSDSDDDDPFSDATWAPGTTQPAGKEASGRRNAGADGIPERLFVSWERLLGAHEGLKMKLDSVVAVHGWERRRRPSPPRPLP